MEFYDRQEGESSKAYAAFVGYRDLGPERSIDKVHKEYGKSTRLLARWSSQWQWVARSQAWDADREQARQAADKAEIARLMAMGYAQAHERIKALNLLACELAGLLGLAPGEAADQDTDKNYWIKGQGGVRFNSTLIEQFRAVLNDLALETGGRIRQTKQEITGKDGQPLQVEVDDISKLSATERATRFVALLNAARARAN